MVRNRHSSLIHPIPCVFFRSMLVAITRDHSVNGVGGFRMPIMFAKVSVIMGFYLYDFFMNLLLNFYELGVSLERRQWNGPMASASTLSSQIAKSKACRKWAKTCALQRLKVDDWLFYQAVDRPPLASLPGQAR